MSSEIVTRPRLYRDPIHGQIKFKRTDLAIDPPNAPHDSTLGWLIPRLIDTPEFQRLRHIRQNGLTNLVFHGTEHSRFTHSMGVSFLAGEMYDRIIQNMGYNSDSGDRLKVISSGLVHDVGHAPFSHLLEEIMREVDRPFKHENMSRRLIIEDTGINRELRRIDPHLPEEIAAFLSDTYGIRKHWRYRLISSQLDADRLDYSVRDARLAGLQGHGFDMPRLLDMLHVYGDESIAIDRHATEAVEAYLVMLEHLYRAIYFHHAIRGATVLLMSIISRAVSLYRAGDTSLFPRGATGREHPLKALLEDGEAVNLDQYSRLGEFHVWSLIDDWQFHSDPALRDLSIRLIRREIFKDVSIPTDPSDVVLHHDLLHGAYELVKRKLSWVTEETCRLYVVVDTPKRTSYKRYDYQSGKPNESIWMIGGGRKPMAIEDDETNLLIAGLRHTNYFARLMVPKEIVDDVREILAKR